MTLMAVAADSHDIDDQAASMSTQDSNPKRHQSMKHRQFGIYASRVRAPSKPGPPASQILASAETDDLVSTADAPPQIPPLAISPRWDSLANTPNNFIFPNSSTGPLRPSAVLAEPAAQPDPQPLAADASYPSSDLEDFILDQHPPPQSAIPHASDGRAAADTMHVENFSRPRKPSIRQQVHESPRLRQTSSPHPELPIEAAAHQGAWPRPRGQSVSSAISTSTFASLPPQPTADMYEPKGARIRNPAAAPVLPRPTLAYNRVEHPGSGHPRDAAPWINGDELRSSFRSQLTASTAQGTFVTERSSVLTKNSSITSLYAGGDEPSVEDVMGMYEKGFRDDSSPEDHDESRPATAGSELNRRSRMVLEALSEPMPMPMPSRTLAVPGSEPLIRDSTAIFRNSGLASTLSLPKDGLTDYGQKSTEKEKRDSAKSLHVDGPSPVRHLSGLTTSTVQSVTVVTDGEDPESRDRYGFRKHNQYISREQYDTWNEGYAEYLGRRRKKWNAFLKESGLMTDEPNRFPAPSAKTKRFIRKGIPPEWRGSAWFYYAGGPAILSEHAGVYDDMLKKKAKEVDIEAIERDLHRTFPDNIKFKPTGAASMVNHEPAQRSEHTVTGSADEEVEPETISALRRVLLAFSIYNPRIGYCQSLNFLAGLLLLFMETEEHCFWLLNVITRVYLPGTHEMNLEGSKVDLGVLMSAIKESLPGVWAKIGGDLEGDPNPSRPSSGKTAKKAKRKDVLAGASDRLPPITLCMTAWFMSCFIGTLPIETTLRVWDVFFYEGSKTLFRIALAIFKLGEAEVKAVTDPMEMFSIVQAMPRRLLDANNLMEACFKRRNGFGHLSQETIESRRQERRDQAQLEREKQASAASAADSGNVTEVESEVRRKGTLFGRKKKSDISAGRPAEVM